MTGEFRNDSDKAHRLLKQSGMIRLPKGIETQLRLHLVLVGHTVAKVGLLQLELAGISANHMSKFSARHRVHVGILQTELPRLLVQLHSIGVVAQIVFLVVELPLTVTGGPL